MLYHYIPLHLYVVIPSYKLIHNSIQQASYLSLPQWKKHFTPESGLLRMATHDCSPMSSSEHPSFWSNAESWCFYLINGRSILMNPHRLMAHHKVSIYEKTDSGLFIRIAHDSLTSPWRADRQNSPMQTVVGDTRYLQTQGLIISAPLSQSGCSSSYRTISCQPSGRIWSYLINQLKYAMFEHQRAHGKAYCGVASLVGRRAFPNMVQNAAEQKN